MSHVTTHQHLTPLVANWVSDAFHRLFRPFNDAEIQSKAKPIAVPLIREQIQPPLWMAKVTHKDFLDHFLCHDDGIVPPPKQRVLAFTDIKMTKFTKVDFAIDCRPRE